MTSRPVHPAALMAVGVVLGWAIAQPFPAHTTTTNDVRQFLSGRPALVINRR
jgi:hypothetical protein